MSLVAGVMTHRKCKYIHCGELFLVKGNRKNFCSRKCSNYFAVQTMRRRTRKRVFADRKCEWCPDEFTPGRAWQRFCSVPCRILWQNNDGRKTFKKRVPKAPPAQVVELVPEVKSPDAEQAA